MSSKEVRTNEIRSRRKNHNRGIHFFLNFLFFSSCAHQSAYFVSPQQGFALQDDDAVVKFESKNLKIVQQYENLEIKKYLELVDSEIENENMYFVEDFDPYSKKSETPFYCVHRNLESTISEENSNQKIIWRKLYVSQNFYLGCKSLQHDLVQSVYLYCKKTKKFTHYYYKLNGLKHWLNKPILACLE